MHASLRWCCLHAAIVIQTSMVFYLALAENAEVRHHRHRPSNQIQIDLDFFLLNTNNASLSIGDEEDAVPTNPVVNDFPEKRFSLWSELSKTEQTYATSILQYTEESWDTPWRNDIESFPYKDLSNEKQSVLNLMGISQPQWDCHINHYYGYQWEDLLNSGVHIYFLMLGWDLESWRYENGTKPAVDGMTWDDLSEKQKKAAHQICYFKETWDELPLTSWVADKWRKNGMVRASYLKDVKILDDEEDAVPENPAAQNFPEKRFLLWSELTPTELTYAESILQYAEATWDKPWRNTIESYPYKSLPVNMKKALILLDISQPQWDCHINHYYGYKWSDLQKSEVNVYFEMLGWNQDSWMDGNATKPAVDGMSWDDLSEKQKKIANQICYFKETWDESPLSSWVVEWRKKNEMGRASYFKAMVQ